MRIFRLAVIAALLAAAAAQAQDNRLPTFQDLRRKLGQSGPITPPAYVPPDDPRCELPEAPAESLVVQLSAYGGQGLSPIAIGSQAVEATTAAVIIEPGAQPLYVVASSFQPVIWRFSGAVGRVRRLILASERVMPGAERDSMPLAGATGVDEDRIFFVRRSGCLHYFTDPASPQARQAAHFVHHQSGRAPQLQTAAEHVSAFSLPSGVITQTPRPWPTVAHILGYEKPDVALAGTIAYYFPDGVVAIDRDSLTSSRPAERYAVLPGPAGLQQLVRRGALTQLSDTEFLIRRSFRFPAELAGAHRATFLLPRGVEMPRGDVGHSCVVSREDVRRVLQGFCP